MSQFVTRLFSRSVSLPAVLALAFLSSPAFAAPTVTLTVLNPPNGSGEVVLAQGDAVQVDFDVVDPLTETSKNDLIQLVDVGSGVVVNSIKRGTALTGTLGINAKDPGMLEVQYIAASDGSLWGSASTTVTVVVDPATILLIDRISALEALLAATGVDLASLGTTVATNTSNIATNASDIGTNASGIASNASGIATNGSAIAANTSAIGTNASGLSTLAADIATNASGIATNASGIATNASGLTSLAGLISTNTSAIGTNASGIASNASGLASLASTVAANTTAIGTNASDIGTNASGIASNASGIATNASAVAALSGTDLPALQTQVSTNTSGIATNASGIGTNASGIATNASAIAALGSVNLTALQTQVNTIAANTVLDLDGMLTFNTATMTARFDGINVQIVDGTGDTYRGPNDLVPNGRGNLIIGYNSPWQPECAGLGSTGLRLPDQMSCEGAGGTWLPQADARAFATGAHNLIVGDGHSYSSWGGAVFGEANGIDAYASTVLGGRDNDVVTIGTDISNWSSISGGSGNRIEGLLGSISGGRENRAEGRWASIAGGLDNFAAGDWGAVAGGRGGNVTGRFNTVTGGLDNTVGPLTEYSVIVGGWQGRIGRTPAPGQELDPSELLVIGGGDQVVVAGTPEPSFWAEGVISEYRNE